jgi:hypothetical protein
VEQRLKLMERRPLVAPQELGDFPERVRALWREMIGSGASQAGWSPPKE